MRTVIITNLYREAIDMGTVENPHITMPGNTVIEAITNTMYPAPATIEMKVTTDKPIDSFKEAEVFIGNLFEGGR